MENQADPGSTSSINRDLAEWAVEYNITLSATGSLLNVLRPHLSTLPQDARALLKTSVHHAVPY